MKDLTQRKWFVWLTAYWFLFPVAGFLLLAAGVFFAEKVQHDKHAHAKEHGHVIHDHLRL